MTNPYRSVREQRAYEAGLAEGRAQTAREQPQLTMADLRGMSQEEINARWPEVVRGLIANQPRGDDA